MPIIGADLSRYDPNAAAGEYPFVILNVEDPGMAVKADIARAAGACVMLYTWVYPGDHGYSLTRSYAAEELLRFNGVEVRFHWLDYEQGGVGPADLYAAKGRVDGRYAPVGTYTYLYLLPQVRDALVGPLWLAYYPSESGDYWPSQSDQARTNGAVMHQFTSTGGTRDLNVVLNEDWYSSIQGENDVTPEQVEEVIFGKPYGVSRFEIAFKEAAEKYLLPTLGAWEGDTRTQVTAAVTAAVNAALANLDLPDGVAVDADAIADAVVQHFADSLGN